jgi:hypothetical protein
MANCRSVLSFSIAAAGLFLVVAASPARAEKSAPAAEMAVPKPPLPAIDSLQLEPPTLTLNNARDARLVLVWGLTKDGQRYDLTDAATFKCESAGTTVGPDRYIAPAAVGDTTITVTAADKTATLPVKVVSADQPKVSFVRDVMPVLSKVGCNAGTCHGAQAGKNGFKLSLRGYDPDYDYNVLINDLQGRRFDRVRPEQSLMLLKPVGAVPHEGRKVFEIGSRPYNLIHQWIKEGVTRDASVSAQKPTKIEILPRTVDLDLPGRDQRLIVLATYPDGKTRDVTRDAVMSSNNEEVAKIKDNKVTGIRRGEAAILVRYEGNYGVAGVAVMGDRAGFAWAAMPEYNFIDKHVNAKLQRRKILPSRECTDAEFVRRVYLDLTGVVPTGAVARAFVEDTTPSAQKRTTLVDQLIGSRDFVAYWSNKWADLLQCNSKALGEDGVWVFREFIRKSVAENMPYDRFVRSLVTAQGSNLTNPAVNYYRALKDKDADGKLTTNKITEDVSQTFLGVRFSCNKCHDHPFERWTQTQYYEFGAFFARVAFKRGERPGEEIVYTSYTGGEVEHPKLHKVLAPSVPYGTPPDVDHARFRTEAFGAWLTSKDNPLFARSYANRVWSYFFGRGIIDPVDDIRASNPPVNPELLDALTEEFIKSGFNTRQLMRTIVLSRTYQLSFVPNQWNQDDKTNFSHAIPRRLGAEQMMDAVAIATGTRPKVPGLPEDLRSVYLADGMLAEGGSDFLKLFGRPKRESACECERTTNVSLAHALNLINGSVIGGAVVDSANSIAVLVTKQPDNAKVVEEIYYSILNRPPTEAEVKNLDLGTDPKHRQEVAEDLAWALLNSPAFLFNR